MEAAVSETYVSGEPLLSLVENRSKGQQGMDKRIVWGSSMRTLICTGNSQSGKGAPSHEACSLLELGLTS